MSDEIIQDIRRIRHRISRQCDHDLHKVVAYYRAFQDELKRSGEYRFYNPKGADDAKTDTADDAT